MEDPQGQPAPEQGGGPAELFQQAGELLSQIAQMTSQADVPPEIAQSFQQIAQQFMQTVEGMLSAQGGGAQGAQPVSPEQGAGNSVPVR